MTLPTQKTPPAPGLASRNILVFGDPKTGKTTLAAGMRPETTIFLATEDGTSAIEAFVNPIRNWQEFLTVANEIKAGGHPFDTIVVDTVDELARMCAEHVIAGLGVSEGTKPGVYLHASDFEYGKGWDAITEEFRLKVAKLCNLGLAVIFLSHTKTSIVKDRTGLESTKFSPDVGKKGMRNWLLGFVDLIAYTYKQETPDGEEYLLRFRGDANVESGGRVPDGAALPETIPTDPESLSATFENVWGTITDAKEPVPA